MKYTIDKGTNYVLVTYPHNPRFVAKVYTTRKNNTFTEKDIVIKQNDIIDAKVDKHCVYFTSGHWFGFKRGSYIMFIDKTKVLKTK